MRVFKLENVWICELSYVYRRKGMLMMHDSNAKHVLVMKEDKSPNQKVANIKVQDYLSEQTVYFNLEGEEFYHGTQKGVYNASDIGKVFVIERKPVPEELLTEEEKKTQKISEKRIEQLQTEVTIS